MSRDLLIILILLAVNLAVAAVYLILHLRAKDRRKGIVNFITFLVFPVVGFVYMGLSELLNLIFFRERRRDINYDELSFGKTRMKLVQDTDVDKSLDSVPLEEALIMSGKKERRQSLMEVLKQDDYTELMDNIKGAVSSEDMEISHYAATFVTQTIARYKGREAELRGQMERSPSSDNLALYIEYAQELVESGLFEGLEQKRYISMLDSAAWKLYSKNPERLLDSNITALLASWQKTGNEEKTAAWMNVVRARSEVSLECFKTYAEHCYRKGDKEAFFDLMASLKYSSVSLDYEALEWVRFFA